MDNTAMVELPELTEAMTAICIRDHTIALHNIVGAKARVCAEVSTTFYRAKPVFVSIYPEGVCGKAACEYFHGTDWNEAFVAAYEWARTRPIIQRDTIIRKLALAIIDITDQHGKCTERLLQAREFTSADIREMHKAACVRAGEMCAGSPFFVVMGAA